MRTKIVEVTNGPQNWGKFLVGVFDVEWERGTVVAPNNYVGLSPPPLLGIIGWSYNESLVWVLDLQTREGAAFRIGGCAAADLEKHKIWVCPLFEPFLEWLYQQPKGSVESLWLPDHVDLPEAEFAFRGHRRPGP